MAIHEFYTILKHIDPKKSSSSRDHHSRFIMSKTKTWEPLHHFFTLDGDAKKGFEANAAFDLLDSFLLIHLKAC
jgi:hypothetical protein